MFAYKTDNIETSMNVGFLDNSLTRSPSAIYMLMSLNGSVFSTIVSAHQSVIGSRFYSWTGRSEHSVTKRRSSPWCRKLLAVMLADIAIAVHDGRQ